MSNQNNFISRFMENDHVKKFIRMVKSVDWKQLLLSNMKIDNFAYTDRKDAGTALIDACRTIQNTEVSKIGEYRGFELSLSFDTFSKEYKCHLKGAMTYTVPLGSDPGGNITRIDNALEKITATLEATETKLEALYAQVENAKEEITRPFPQEQELTDKSARLTELDALLSLDGKDNDAQNAVNRKGNVPDTDSISNNADSVKIHAANDGITQRAGDESAPPPETPPRNIGVPANATNPQAQYPQANSPQQQGTHVNSAVTPKPEADERPQAKPKKKSQDER